jgi:hypothetical protein
VALFWDGAYFIFNKHFTFQISGRGILWRKLRATTAGAQPKRKEPFGS